jgi:UDP-glucose 4-epimerase
VLLTGATGTIGRQLCHALYHDERVERVFATARDGEPYYFREYDRQRFVYKQVDILKSREVNNLFLSEAFRQAEIDCVVHLAFANRPHAGDGTHSLNVEGTKHLLDRCIETGHIKKFVFQSSDSVYKIRPWNPILLDEEADLNFSHEASQYVRDRVDADMICRAQLGNTSCKVVVVRPASIVGRNVHSHWNALLDNHWVIFKVLGYDPMIAPTHSNDVIRALKLAIQKDVAGVFNIAGIDVAPLSVFIRLAGAYAVPLPAAALRWVNGVQRTLGLTQYNFAAFPEALRYHCLLDTTRAREVLGFTPQYHIKFG